MVSAGSHVAEFCLHGVSITLESDLEEFATYVRRATAPFTSSDAPRFSVHSRLKWHEGPPPADPALAFPGSRWSWRPDRDLYLGEGEAQWLRIDDFPALQLAVRWAGDSMELIGRYHFQIGGDGWIERMRRLRYGHRLDRLRARRFSTLLYYLVYHPMLWWLSRVNGWHVLHAGAVAQGAEALVFSGMPGCGKSTLVVALLADPSRFMLSDNLLLHDREAVHACPELLLLDPPSRERAGPGARRLVATGERRVYGREAYRPDSTVQDRVRPVAIFNLGRGSRTECTLLEPERAVRLLQANNVMAKEVRRIEIMDRVLDCVAQTEAPEQGADLRAMLERVPCYALWIAADAPLDGVIRDHVLPAVSRRTRDPRVSGSVGG